VRWEQSEELLGWVQRENWVVQAFEKSNDDIEDLKGIVRRITPGWCFLIEETSADEIKYFGI
jgi:hypothetical protein